MQPQRETRSTEWYFHKHQGYAEALAMEIASRLGRRVDREELLQYARLGLWEAAQRFDPECGAAFTTFAYKRVRGAVFNGIRKLAGSTSPAVLARIQAEEEYLDAETAQPQRGRTREERARRLFDLARGLGTIYLASWAGEDGSIEIEDPDATDKAERNDLLARVRDAWAELPDRQRLVLDLLYRQHRSFTECAEQLGVHKAQITRDHQKAIARLRALCGFGGDEEQGGARRATRKTRETGSANPAA